MPQDETNTEGWAVGYTDRADADIEAAYQFLASRVEEGKAEAWLRGLYLACANLADFPGPFAHPIEETATQQLGQEVRRFLYRGPQGQRPIGAPYRVYFYTVENQAIFVMRVLHGASGPWSSP